MQEGSSVFEGIVDVGVLVPSCFDNPLRQESVNFLNNVLLERTDVLLPVTAVIGAYHIATNYLKVSRIIAKTIFSELLRTGSGSFYSEVSLELASSAFDYSVAYDIESWDGYLVAIARKFDARIVYSIDEELGESLKTKGEPGSPLVVNPFSARNVKEYHKFLERKIGRE